MESLLTERLELRPITLELVVALLEGRRRGEIESVLGAQMPWTWPSRALVEQVFHASLEAVRADPETRLWGDRLLVTRGEPHKVVGSVVFHGRPGPDGVAELGFGIEDASQGQGYATEALRACIGWALAQPECRIVRASTSAWHKASRRVLEKIGMRHVGDHGEGDVRMRVYEIARASSS